VHNRIRKVRRYRNMRNVIHLERPPWLYRLSANLVRKGWRGSTRLMRAASKSGQFNYVVSFAISKNIHVDVPLFTDNVWDEATILSYENVFIRNVAHAASTMQKPVHLIDCGAGFGLFSARMIAAFPGLESITSFEPNTEMFDILVGNLVRLGIPVSPRNCAVSNVRGYGELRVPDYDSSPDAYYLQRGSAGAIQVTTIDSLAVDSGRSLILKIDVEGEELNVIRGALETLSQVDEFLVTIEANPKVVERTGIDPMECVRLLQQIRPCSAQVGELIDIALTADCPFFDQVPERKTYNIMCRSTKR
jgi:FkbM family methyltransferase